MPISELEIKDITTFDCVRVVKFTIAKLDLYGTIITEYSENH